MNNPRFGVTVVDDGLKLRQTVFLFQVAFECFEQFATKSHTKLPHRIKVFAFVANVFNLATGRNAHGRNNAMNVWMKTQVLSPGMEYTNGTGLDTVMRVTKGTQSFFYAGKKILVKALTVDHTNRI